MTNLGKNLLFALAGQQAASGAAKPEGTKKSPLTSPWTSSPAAPEDEPTLTWQPKPGLFNTGTPAGPTSGDPLSGYQSPASLAEAMDSPSPIMDPSASLSKKMADIAARRPSV